MTSRVRYLLIDHVKNDIYRLVSLPFMHDYQ